MMKFKHLVISTLLIATCIRNTYAGTHKSNYVEGKLLAKFKPGIALDYFKSPYETGIGVLDSLNRKCGCTSLKPLLPTAGTGALLNIYVFTFKQHTPLDSLINLYMATGLFQYVEPDQIVHGNSAEQDVITPNDQYFYRQWALHNDATFTMDGLYTPKKDADIDMPEAWELEQGDSSVIVAILDSGCKMDHPELAGRLWKNEREIPGNNIDDDNNGFIDDVHGWDFINDDNDPTDDRGHGTALAGIIGANWNNRIGLAGVNPHVKIMVIKVLGSLGEGNTSLNAKGIEYAVKMKANLVNMSLVHSSYIETEIDIIKLAHSKNVTIIAGTGNRNIEKIGFPAAYDEVIAVGASGPDDNRYLTNDTTGSNYGNEISLVAPGKYIFYIDEEDNNKFNSYGNGTSYATAFVTGVASLLLSKNPSLTPEQIRTILQNSADDQVGDPSEDTKGWDKYYGWGRLNAHRALQMTSAVRNTHYQLKQFIAARKNVLHVEGIVISPVTRHFTLNGSLVKNKTGAGKVRIAPGFYIYQPADVNRN